MSELKASRLFTVTLFAGLTAACSLPAFSPRASEAARCEQGIDMFERSRCGGIVPTVSDRPVVDAEYQNFQIECTDTASVQRLETLSGCVAGYHGAQKAQKGKHDGIREEYDEEAAAVKADPDYMPTLEAWALARDEAQIAHDDWQAKGRGSSSSPYYRVYEQKNQKVEELNEKMRELLKKHGIDPKHAGVLGLW